MSRRLLVAVFGAGDVGVGSPEYGAARELGRRLVEAGYRVLTGGGGGVMEAACRGAREASSYREGDTLGILPGLDPRRANPYVDIVLPSPLGHARNSLVSAAEVVIAYGGHRRQSRDPSTARPK